MSYNNVKDSAVTNNSAIEGTFDPVVHRIIPHEHHNYLIDIIDGIIAIIAAIASIITAGGASLTLIGILELIAEQTAIAAAADVATQGVNLAGGVQHKFNFKELAFSMGTAALAAGSGAGAAKIGADFLERLTISELTELLNQTVEKSLHIEKHISWTGFVIAALNTTNQAIGQSAKVKSNPALAKTFDTIFAGIESTISGLQDKHGSHYHFDVIAIAANMIGTYAGETLQDDRNAQVHLPRPQDTEHTKQNVSEHALAQSEPPQDIATLQAQKQQQAARDHALVHHQQRATQQHAQLDEADQLLDDTLKSASHFLWQHRDGIIDGMELFSMAAGAATTGPKAANDPSGLHSFESKLNTRLVKPAVNDYHRSSMGGFFAGLSKGLADAALDGLETATTGSADYDPHFSFQPNQQFGKDIATGFGLFALSAAGRDAAEADFAAVKGAEGSTIPKTMMEIPKSSISPNNIGSSELASFSNKVYKEVRPGRYFQAQRFGQKGMGQFFTPVKPLDSMDAEEMLNIKAWGNNADQVAIVEIKHGLMAWQGGIKGGAGEQLFIPHELHPDFINS
jgi:hypothetical protein